MTSKPIIVGVALVLLALPADATQSDTQRDIHVGRQNSPPGGVVSGGRTKKGRTRSESRDTPAPAPRPSPGGWP